MIRSNSHDSGICTTTLIQAVREIVSPRILLMPSSSWEKKSAKHAPPPSPSTAVNSQRICSWSCALSRFESTYSAQRSKNAQNGTQKKAPSRNRNTANLTSERTSTICD